MVNKQKRKSTVKGLKHAFVCVPMLGIVGVAQAMPIDLGSPDWVLNADTTVRVNAGIRTQSIDSKIADNPSYDESDYKFKAGDLINARLDLLEEVDLAYHHQYGIRLSGAGWFDAAYDDKVKTHPGNFDSSFVAPGATPGTTVAIPTSVPYSALGSYDNNRYSSFTKRFYRGPSGELLDAFVFANFQLGDISVGVKAGQHTVYWGEGLFFANQSIAYGQAPIDGVKAVTSPGIETKEVFLPTPQITFSSQLTSALTLAGQYTLGWQHSRYPAGGTYMGATDWLYEGTDRFFTGTVIPGSFVGAASDQPVFLIHQGSKEPGGVGKNYGVNLRYSFQSVGGTGGFYYRKFDDPTPFSAPQVTQTATPTPIAGGLSAGTYNLVYNRHTELYGLSYTQAVNGVSYAGEVSYRDRTALNNVGISADGHGPVGRMLNANVDSILVLPTNFLAPTTQVTAELAYSHLIDITDHQELYNGVNTANCPVGAKSAGCSTKNYLTAELNLTPQYPQAFPGVDISLPISASYGINGNYAGVGGGNEGAITYSGGVEALYKQLYDVTLSYQGSFNRSQPATDAGYHPGGSGAWFYNDRGRVVLTAKFSF